MTKTDTNTKTTPPRHNYANQHTPIASIKRPRSSLDRRTPHRGTSRRSSPIPPTTPNSGEALSPLHPPKSMVAREGGHGDHPGENTISSSLTTNGTNSNWVNRKVDALFSPVLNFLHDEEREDHRGDEVETVEDPTSCCDGSVPSDDDGSLQAVQDMEDDDFNPWQFIKSLPPYHLVRHLTPPVALPPKTPDSPPLTLVLDLDETLVHCSVEQPPTCDLEFGVEFHGVDYQVYVKKRPHLERFLQKVSNHFEVIVFTASQPVYANELLNRIDPDMTLIHHRLFRESCLQVEGNYLKDLNVLGRDLSKTVLVDNSPHAFGYQLDNGIPIESWFEDPGDRELIKLENFLLRQLVQSPEDVRTLVRRKFQNHQRVLQAPDYA